MWALIIFAVPFILFAVAIDICMNKLFSKDLFEKKQNEQIIGKIIDENQSKLPWD